MKPTSSFATLLQRFFTQRLMQQRQASPHTISSYRDTFRLLLQFALKRSHMQPARVAFEDIDAPLISAFLDELQNSRGISARSRNIRLAAVRSFFNFAAFEMPARSAQIQRVLAIPSKRYARRQIAFLTRAEVDALLAVPSLNTWSGRRDHVMMLLTVQTGARLSEITGLKRQDVILGSGAHIHVVGKGRKERCTPLTKQSGAALKSCYWSPPEATARSCSPMLEAGISARMGCNISWPSIRPSPAKLAHL
jgi:site-specific recombinase XerD